MRGQGMRAVSGRSKSLSVPSPSQGGPPGGMVAPGRPLLRGSAAAAVGPHAHSEAGGRAKTAITVLVIITVVVGGVLFHDDVTEALDRFVDWVGQLGWAAPVMVAILVSAMTLVMLPTFPLMVGAGVIFPKTYGVILGQGVGVAAVFGGMWLGGMLAFMLGRRCLKDWVERELKDFTWMHVINAMIEEQGWWVVMLARASPLMPCEVFNYACSLTSLTIRGYAIGCLGSLVPTAIWVCSAASAAAATMEDEGATPQERQRKWREHALFLGVNVGFLGLLSGLLYTAVRKYNGKAAVHIERQVHMVVAQLGDECTEEHVRVITRRMTRGVHTLKRNSFHQGDIGGFSRSRSLR